MKVLNGLEYKRSWVPYVANVQPQSIAPSTFINDLKGTRVLVIDDETMIRLGMRKVLEEWGCEVKDAESIEQALNILTQKCEIDIILTDYRLRENTTGIEAIQHIHAACGKTIPAIILTGDTDPQRLRDAKDSGFRSAGRHPFPRCVRGHDYHARIHGLQPTDG